MFKYSGYHATRRHHNLVLLTSQRQECVHIMVGVSQNNQDPRENTPSNFRQPTQRRYTPGVYTCTRPQSESPTKLGHVRVRGKNPDRLGKPCAWWHIRERLWLVDHRRTSPLRRTYAESCLQR